jgi:hypothetical protein
VTADAGRRSPAGRHGGAPRSHGALIRAIEKKLRSARFRVPGSAGHQGYQAGLGVATRVKTHDFHNVIVLCANCHGRKGSRRGQIDRKSLRQYKVNLAVVNSRYGELERRILDYFADIRPAWTKVETSCSR